MGSINLFKIEETKKEEFLQIANSKYNQKSTVFIEKDNKDYGFTLFIDKEEKTVDLSWSWILPLFGTEIIPQKSKPKAILLVEENVNDLIFAITFGASYFLIDKYCDKDFGFNFARRIPFKEIKTTTLTAPNSNRNKMVNTYINYNELEFDSGESYAKLKAIADIPEDFNLFKPTLEIGSSIKITMEEDSLENIAGIINYIVDTIMHKEERYKIPVFSKVSDSNFRDLLEERMKARIRETQEIAISELDVIGATEIFNRNDSEYILKYRRKEKKIVSLNSTVLKDFCEESNLDYNDVLLDISVQLLVNGQSVSTKKVKDIIDYTDDEERCLLSNGQWYHFNDDYMSYLKSSINELETYYYPEFDFSRQMINEYIEAVFPTEKDSEDYIGMSDKDIKNSLSKKYYRERVFNELMATDKGFINYDRQDQSLDGHKIEIMDLYKDKCMFAVKIGNSSAKLCFAVDQSINSIKMYKHRTIPDLPEIDKVGIWLILDRMAHIEDENGTPNINRLEMLMLKNRLDQWKKEVRLMGYKPVVYINYFKS